MFKLLVLSVFVAVAAAAPSGIHGYSAYPAAYDYVENVVTGKIVEHVPTAVSHQSRVDYHSKPVITPILAPVTKVIPQPAYEEYHATPIVHAAPVVHSAPLVHSAPYAHSSSYVHSSPIVHSADPWAQSW